MLLLDGMVIRMARMHSRAKGKSGSRKPLSKDSPEWVSYKANEVEMLVAKLAKQGLSAAEIGLSLRDSYGIPSIKALTGKTISKILEEKKLAKELPEDLIALMRKSIQLTKHLEENSQDRSAKRGLQLTTSKINRLVTYYKKTGVVDKGWQFRQEQASYYTE
jgi:small subunit ribosomal protein S15